MVVNRDWSPTGNPYGFSGRRLDEETGLMHYRLRAYHPLLKTFLQRDPAGYIDGPSLYQYVAGNPIRYIDPYGLGLSSWILTGDWNASDEVYDAAYDAFSESNHDRTSGTADAAVERATWGIVDSVGGTTFDAENRADAKETADGIMETASAVSNLPGIGKAVVGAGIKVAKSKAKKEAKKKAAKEAAEKAAKAQKKCKGKKCFVAGTLVLTESGERPIEEISSGEKVWSANPQTGEWQLQEVVVPISHEYDGDVVTIKVGDYATESTGGHPFWIVDGHALADRPVVEELPAAETELTDRGRWVEARDVEVGDTVLLHFGSTAAVTEVSSRYERLTVYNITVSGWHNYAVGEAHLLVHNDCGPDDKPHSSQKKKQYDQDNGTLDQLEGLEGAQQASRKRRPSKRPGQKRRDKSHDIYSTKKSEQKAKHDNYGYGRGYGSGRCQ